MNCNEARQHWNLYHDSEGDVELHFRISEHLALCPECAQWFSQQSRLEGLLVDKMRNGPTTPELWDQVLSRCGLRQPAPARRWLWLSGVAAGALFALAVFWYPFRPAGPPSPDLTKLSAEWHQRLEAGEETPQFRSQSDHEVEGYLRQRVTFPVHCPPRKDARFSLAGAGVCSVKDKPAAYIVGQVEQVPVSIFVLARSSLDAFPHDREQLSRGGGRHQCREGKYLIVSVLSADNVVVVIGEAASQTLEKVVNAYGSYHGAEGV